MEKELKIKDEYFKVEFYDLDDSGYLRIDTFARTEATFIQLNPDQIEQLKTFLNNNF